MATNGTGAARTVVITGASTGIGEACALHLDQLGWRVFAGVRKDADGEALQKKSSPRLMPIRIDVTDAASIAAARDVVLRELGDRGLDGLVNNAGVAVAGPLEFLPIEDLRRQLEINVIGQIAVTHAKSSPQSVSSSDAGRRVRISVRTGWPVESELPRSPCASSFRYKTNWRAMLLSRPSCTRICSIASGDGFSPITSTYGRW